MRYFYNYLILFGLCLLLAGPVSAQEYSSTVPTAVEQIPDDVFRNALAQYSPYYNNLTRDGQIQAYINIYKVLNNGQDPYLTAQDIAILNSAQQPVYQTTAPEVYYYSDWDQPSYYYDRSPSIVFGFDFGSSYHRPGWGPGRPGWGHGRPGGWSRPPNHGGPGRPGGPGHGRPGGPGHGRPGGPGHGPRPR